MSSALLIFFAFSGAFCLGFTAVLLARASVDNVYYGLIIRALGSVPIVLVSTLLLQGADFLGALGDLRILAIISFGALMLVFADIFIMSILKRKPVGIIAPLIAIFPLFTTVLLIITGYAAFSPAILGYTLLIVIGVAVITYDNTTEANNSVPFDLEAMGYGLLIAIFLGLTNYMDVVVLEDTTDLDGLSYTSLKFSLLLIISLVFFIALRHSWSDWKHFTRNTSSTKYLLLAGLTAWALGSLFIYTAYNNSDPRVVNAIIGINPVFGVIVSLLLGMEKLNAQKVIGLLFCVVASIGIVNL